MSKSGKLNSPSTVEYIINDRDLRLDLLRGLIMVLVIATHLEYFSLMSMFAWERIGLVSSAEGFVTLSGIVLGIVYRKKLHKTGFRQSTLLLWKRAFQLYRANLAIILSILVLRTLPFVNVHEVTHWINPWSGQAYPLFPAIESAWTEIMTKTLLLQIGPHQFQIIGFYCIVIALAPIALYLLYHQHTLLLLVSSWTLYLINSACHVDLTSALFERAFPLLTWQVLFFNGMVIGYHHQTIFRLLSSQNNKLPVILATITVIVLLFLTHNNPNPIFWPWHSIPVLNSDYFSYLHIQWFDKTNLGIGRIINNIALFIVLFYVLTHHWTFWNRLIGWLLIPIGQASLYVFVVHIYLIIIISSTPLPDYDRFIINTLIHLCSILLVWLMIKNRFLFSLIPR